MRNCRIALLALAAAFASACSHLPELPQLPSIGSPHATPDLSPRERVRLAIELLGEGQASGAEVELRAALEEQPNNSAARRLLQQITDDPRAMLGQNARPYTVRQGETMSTLAERYLGDPLLFYALARYNGLDAPNRLAAGQQLMVPQRAGAAATAASAAAGAPTPPATPNMQPRGIDPVRANQLRLQGLQRLNAGEVNAAITLLREAQALDEGNPAIQRDLDRAMRLQAALGNGRG